MHEKTRYIPKVDTILNDPGLSCYAGRITHSRILVIVREEIQKARERILSGENINLNSLTGDIISACTARLEDYTAERMTKVINATGVILHTNLGRTPLSPCAARKAFEISSGYSNLEYSVTNGKRRSRLVYVEKLITDLTGAEAAIIVNNNAAAVFLALNTLCNKKNVILSRGEIVEIGDSFRISEIIKVSGCDIKEVGTTNRTCIRDYKAAIDDNTAMLLKVHTSNFKIVGYTEETETSELVRLGCEYAIPVMEDMGSGVLVDLTDYGCKYERRVQDAIEDGVDIVTFSGDKMLGGPQAGIITGKKKYIDLMRQNQLLRCLRIDKLCLAALEATLEQYIDKQDTAGIPVISYISAAPDEIRAKAERLVDMIGDTNDKLTVSVGRHDAQIGGGSMPAENIESYGVFLNSKVYSASQIERMLRSQQIPVIATTQRDNVILDMRTVDESDFEYLAEIIRRI